MRVIKYLSPTSISKFYSDRVEWYLQYAAENRPPKIPQTRPMAIGSAFDAFVKNYLVGNLLGKPSPQFEIEAIFEAQVEPHNRDWAFEQGELLFNKYRDSGALADLMLELSYAVETPRFEFEVENRVAHSRFVDGIPLLGKPDCHVKLRDGRTLTIDWKVNGYCASPASPTSPKKGYVRIRPGGGMHKDCQPLLVSGITLNGSLYLEDVNKDWANQTCIYMWILGEDIPTKGLVGIEQLAGNLDKLRVASHRLRISECYQLTLLDKIVKVWDIIQSGHIFDNLSRAESDARCGMLDLQYAAFEGETENDKWFRENIR